MYNIAICDDDKIFIQYLKRMILSASEDKNYNKYPRFKIIDDITIVKISL